MGSLAYSIRLAEKTPSTERFKRKKINLTCVKARHSGHVIFSLCLRGKFDYSQVAKKLITDQERLVKTLAYLEFKRQLSARLGTATSQLIPSFAFA